MNRACERSAGRAPASIGISVLFTLLGGMPLFLVTSYSVTLQAEFGFGGAQLGLMVSGYFAGSLLGAQAGFLVDRTSAGVGLRVSALLSALCALLIATVAGSWLEISLSLVLSGVANSVGQLASNRLLAGLSRQGLGFGMKQAAAPLTGLVAGSVVSAVGTSTSWRSVFVVFAAVAVAVALALPANLVAEKGRLRQPDRGLGAARPQLLLLAAGGALGGATANSLALLSVDSLSRTGFTEADAVLVVAMASGLAVGARVLVGWLLDYLGTNGYRELIRTMLAGSCGFLVLSVGMSLGGHRTLVLLGTFAAFAAGWAWPAIIYFVVVQNTSVPPATSTGIIMTGVFVGTLVGAPTLALLAEVFSYSLAWAAATLVSVVAAGLAHLSRSVAHDP